MAGVEFRVLGPLEVVVDGRPVPIAGAKARAVLAHLVRHAGRPVPPDALMAEVWGAKPPATAVNTLQTYVSQLRRALGSERSRLRFRPGGYVLDAEDVDSRHFEALLGAARSALTAGDAARAEADVTEALGLWRGEALADVRGFAGAEREAERLERLRLLATELRMDAGLALGRHTELVDEITELAREHPLREPITGQLMVALYRTGRQAEALAAYRETRNRLVHELGVEPGGELRDLERRILQQDPTLAAPRSPGTPGRPRRRRMLAAAAVLAAALVGLGAVVAAAELPGDDRYNDFDLGVHPGIGYDLDIPPGRPADWHATNNPRSADYQYLDLYRTAGITSRPQLSGVDLDNTGRYNAIHRVGRSDTLATCRTLPTDGGGNVRLADLTEGARACLHTRGGHWALLTVVRMPPEPSAVLMLHVEVQ
jgi:DNA-binding SARP family transcriptional activator